MYWSSDVCSSDLRCRRRRRGRERSVPFVWPFQREQEQLAARAPSSGASRHLLPQAGEGLTLSCCGLLQAAALQQRLHARVLAAEVAVQGGEVDGVAAREDLVAEGLAVLAGQATVLLEPLERVV